MRRIQAMECLAHRGAGDANGGAYLFFLEELAGFDTPGHDEVLHIRVDALTRRFLLRP
jgi:hypothetical protein